MILKLNDLTIFRDCDNLTLSGDFCEGEELEVRFRSSKGESRFIRKVRFNCRDGLYIMVKNTKLFLNDFDRDYDAE